MPEANHQPTDPPASRGEQLAVSMVQQLSVLSAALAAREATDKGLIVLLDELNGRLETLTVACKILAEMKADGKPKIGFGEFAEAMAQADEEVMNEDDEEEEEDGRGDVPLRR